MGLFSSSAERRRQKMRRDLAIRDNIDRTLLDASRGSLRGWFRLHLIGESFLFIATLPFRLLKALYDVTR